MKKQWISVGAVIVLVFAAVFLIAGRMIPRDLADLMPESFQPESGHVIAFGWDTDVDLTEEELNTLWTLLEELEYRYDGKAPGGIMTGELYHLTFFQKESAELVDLFVTKSRGIVYLDKREYEMIGDTKPLLEFLNGLK